MTSDTAVQESRRDQLKAALQWDWGTAYDLFFSIHAILMPKDHGLPAPWAAGVRKRLSAQGQRDLKDFFNASSFPAYAPLRLILELSRHKDAQHLIDYAEAIPDDEFSRRIHLPRSNQEVAGITTRALNGERMSDADIEEYRRAISRLNTRPVPTAADARRLFNEMAEPAETKKRWLSVVKEYQAVFYAEEEKRLKPVLERMLRHAQDLSKKTSVPDMIERISNGFTLSEDIDLRRLVLVPSVWFSPFVFRFELADRELFVAWGSQPPSYKLVPGESVPTDALLVLRALGDPTRLRLLRLIAAEPRSLQSLAHEVRLSLPTVSHHIRELRVAGLIRLEMGGRGRESKYTVRWPSASRAFEQLENFVLPRGAGEA